MSLAVFHACQCSRQSLNPAGLRDRINAASTVNLCYFRHSKEAVPTTGSTCSHAGFTSHVNPTAQIKLMDIPWYSWTCSKNFQIIIQNFSPVYPCPLMFSHSQGHCLSYEIILPVLQWGLNIQSWKVFSKLHPRWLSWCQDVHSLVHDLVVLQTSKIWNWTSGLSPVVCKDIMKVKSKKTKSTCSTRFGP